ncbi:MAG TPA: hypothetical protein PKJ33_03010 [Alphaproteobacteria bacterium]|nr:hypothetical protein [Alphaproteobacteria bacterium]
MSDTVKPIKLNKPNARISTDEAEFLLKGLRELYSKTNSIAVKKEIKGLASTVMYVASETRQANFASKAALEIWSNNNIIGDLKNLTIGKQRANKKKIPILNELLLEHCVPLSVLFKAIFEQNKDIKYVLGNELITSWITKNEDRRLNQCGYKSARPDSWTKCYADCGIEIK